jgi:hypothetical protein
MTLAVRVILLVFAALVNPYQWRISLNTIHVETYLDFFVPVVFEPFSNRIGQLAHASSWEIGKEYRPLESPAELRRGGEVLNVDGQPFRGLSRYLRELWYVQHQPIPEPPEYTPFTLTVRSGNSVFRQIAVSFPHCTCGVPTEFEAASVWLIPPMFCLALGFFIAFLRPTAPLAWAFLVLMLSVTQLQFWPDEYTGFQQTVTPMLWANPALRVLGVGYRALMQHAWPAALIFASAYFYRDRFRPYRLAQAISASFLAFASLRTALAIAWSENYRPWEPVYRVLGDHQTAVVIVSFAAVTVLAWFVDKKLGAPIAVVAFVSAGLFYTPAAPITNGYWQGYSDNTFRYEATVPGVYNTPEVIIAIFVVGVLGAILIVCREQVMRWEVIGFFSCVPLAADVAMRWSGYWYPFGPALFPYWPWVVLALAGIGLLCVSQSVVRRSDSIITAD